MKHLIRFIFVAISLMLSVNIAVAGLKQDKRVAYVLTQLKLPAQTSTKLKPMLQAYLVEKKAANKPYDDLKESYQAMIARRTLTSKQADALLKAKWAAEAKELEVKKAYELKFRTVLTSEMTYICFTLLNDKWSKIEPSEDEE